MEHKINRKITWSLDDYSSGAWWDNVLMLPEGMYLWNIKHYDKQNKNLLLLLFTITQINTEWGNRNFILNYVVQFRNYISWRLLWFIILSLAYHLRKSMACILKLNFYAIHDCLNGKYATQRSTPIWFHTTFIIMIMKWFVWEACLTQWWPCKQ